MDCGEEEEEGRAVDCGEEEEEGRADTALGGEDGRGKAGASAARGLAAVGTRARWWVRR